MAIDRSVKYMEEMWGTTSLTTNYWSLPKETNDPEERVIQEIMHDDLKQGQKNLQE